MGADHPGETPKFTLRLPDSIRERLQALADAEKRTLSAYVAIILTEHAEAAYAKNPGFFDTAEAKRWLAHAKGESSQKKATRAPRKAPQAAKQPRPAGAA